MCFCVFGCIFVFLRVFLCVFVCVFVRMRVRACAYMRVCLFANPEKRILNKSRRSYHRLY